MAAQKTHRNIEDWAHDLPAGFIECRTMGHRWEPHTAAWDKEARAYHVTHECDRCGTQRKAWWSRTGEISAASYSYPDGYLTKDVGYIGAEGRGVLRTEYLTRVFSSRADSTNGRKRAS
ncbi:MULTISPECIES: hypothetical protein [unclassified Frankia]|uniref:hypothetical protein n=1 Tax=unclassified Frankia TaxID=2632575 RepID=UPI001EF61032|nr:MULTISPECIES: hypothetical protein [unclassified Frankia]